MRLTKLEAIAECEQMAQAYPGDQFYVIRLDGKRYVVRFDTFMKLRDKHGEESIALEYASRWAKLPGTWS